MNDHSAHVSVGSVMRISSVPDQSLYVRSLRGKLCIVVRHCTSEHGVISSSNIWDVLIDGKVVRLHALDLQAVQAAVECATIESGEDRDGN